MANVRRFFEQPGLWFNLLSLAFTAVGALLGIWALSLAYVQLRKTQQAAEAARDAAERALTEVRTATAVGELERLSGLSREVITAARADHLEDVVRSLHDLRIGLARAKAGRVGANLFAPAEAWNAIIAEVAGMERRVRRSVKTGLPDRGRHELIDRIADFDQKLNELSPRAIDLVTNEGQ